MVRLGVVTDIHYGFDTGKKMGSKAGRLVDRFLRVAAKYKAACTINLGDHVSRSKDPDADRNQTLADQNRAHYQSLSDHFNASSLPHYKARGNHDLYLPPMPSTVEQVGHITLIVWNPDYKWNDDGFYLDPADISWLQNALDRAGPDAVLCSHIPLSNMPEDLEESMLIDKRRNLSFYPEGPMIQKMLEESGKVFLCLSGHQHRNRMRDINGIRYLTFQSLVQHNDAANKPSGAFYLLDIGEDRSVRVRGFGHGQKSYTLPGNNNPRPLPSAA